MTQVEGMGWHSAWLRCYCGDAAEYFDPLSPADMARAIAAVLDDPARYVEGGIARARLFTWEACARAHDDVYRRLAS